MERKKSYVYSMEEGIRRTQEGNFAFIGEAVSLDLAVSRYCKMTRSQEIIAMRAYSIAAPLGEPFGPVRMFSVVWEGMLFLHYTLNKSLTKEIVMYFELPIN